MTVPVAERLAAKTVRAENGCLRFTGAHNSRGYGVISVNGERKLAHRVAYELTNAAIPDGLQIDHVLARGCVHKDCVEPMHLEAVTQLENQRRTPEATKTHCKNGHEYTAENTITKRRKNGLTIRNCRACNNEQQRMRAFERRYLDQPVPVTPAEPESERVAS